MKFSTDWEMIFGIVQLPVGELLRNAKRYLLKQIAQQYR